MPSKSYDSAGFLPSGIMAKITDLRVERPDLVGNIAAKRIRRRVLAPDGKLTILAADHPARMVTSVRDDPVRMGDRHDFLSRVARVMACSPFDGLLGTADVLDEILLLEHLLGGKRALVGRRLLVGSVNRGGIASTSFELDDRITGYDASGIMAMRLDAAKFLLRFDPDDERSSRTLSYCAEILRACAAKRIPVFVEPLPVVRRDGRVTVDNNRDKLLKLVGVVSGLGSSSSRVWLKLPYCDGFDKVAGATTLPIVLLGGEAGDDVGALFREIESGMKAGPNVRGVLMGRNLLYPPGGDPLPLAMAVHSMVHSGTKASEAKSIMDGWVGKDLDVFHSNV